MQLDGCPTIQYQKRRGQRNLRIRVRHDAVLVSAPWHCSRREMEQFVAERESWIRQASQRIFSDEARKRDELASRLGHILLRGQWIPAVRRDPRPGSQNWLLVERSTRIDVYPPDGVQPDTVTEIHSSDSPGKIWPLIDVPADIRNEFCRSIATKELPLAFEQLASELGFTWNRLFIRSQKTKWGTCSAKGHISLNWRLVKCPETIRRYIIIHELCHTVHLNHSPAFWGLVKSHYTEVDSAHKWLKTQGSLAFL